MQKPSYVSLLLLTLVLIIVLPLLLMAQLFETLVNDVFDQAVFILLVPLFFAALIGLRRYFHRSN